MLLIWIDDYTLHNMDNGVTYSRDVEYNVRCKDASQHDDRVFKMDNIIATGESGKVFWGWLLKQSAIPMPRPEHLTPQAAPVETPRKFLTDDRVRVKDGNPKAGACGTIVSVYSAGTTCRIELDDDETEVYNINQLEFAPAG